MQEFIVAEDAWSLHIYAAHNNTLVYSLGALAGVSVLSHSPRLGVLSGVGVLSHCSSLGVLSGVSVLSHSSSLGVLAGVNVL